MSEFEVKTYQVVIEKHPDPEVTQIECARIGDFYTVVGKGQFQTGDVAAYIPENSLLPDNLIESLGLTGKLHGSKKNRVKAIRLRGVVSQGLVYKVPDVNEMGVDVTEKLGITKYEPIIPIHMSGQMWNTQGRTLHYDIENIKKYPEVLQDGEEVVVTEKLHGTWCAMGRQDDKWIVTSKGMSARGLAFKLDEGTNDNNLYVKTFRKYQKELENILFDNFFVLGEIYGKGVQDMQYDTVGPEFRVFDVYQGTVGQGDYLDHPLAKDVVQDHFNYVPVLYEGSFDKETILSVTKGTSEIATHMREGVVVKPLVERKESDLGRVILKSVSDEYLLRKNKNATEYQ